MTCQRCGKRDATVHLVEMVDSRRVSRWLCDVCAGRAPENDPEDKGYGFGAHADASGGDEESYSLASFLGQMFEPTGKPPEGGVTTCPSCRYTLDQFRGTNRLGCPRCYDAFRGPLLSILGHLHRHASHLGKVPGHGKSPTSRTGALKRARVALEKAIAAEDFEKAARLRDEISRLEISGDGFPS